MGHIVNATAEAAFDWQRPVVWIRINIGYMLIETADLAKQGDQVTDLEALLSQFNDTFVDFCQAELDFFKAARRTEVDKTHAPALDAALEVMTKSFSPWLRDLNSLVIRRQEGPPDTVLSLVLSCGMEILNAHKAFIDVVDAFRKHVV